MSSQPSGLRRWVPDRPCCHPLDREIVSFGPPVFCRHGHRFNKVLAPCAPSHPVRAVAFPMVEKADLRSLMGGSKNSIFGQVVYNRRILSVRNNGGRIEILCDYDGRRRWYETKKLSDEVR